MWRKVEKKSLEREDEKHVCQDAVPKLKLSRNILFFDNIEIPVAFPGLNRLNRLTYGNFEERSWELLGGAPQLIIKFRFLLLTFRQWGGGADSLG